MKKVLLLTLAALAAAAWYADRRASALVEARLRQAYFTDPSRATFERAGIDWLGPRIFVRGVRLHALSGDGWTAEAGASELASPLTWRQLLSGQAPADRIYAQEPYLDVSLSSAPSGGSGQPALTGLAAAPAGLRELSCSNGTLRLALPEGKALTVSHVGIVLGRSEDGVAKLHAEGHWDRDPQAGARFDARLQPDGSFDGEARLEELPIPALAGLLPADPDLSFQSGRLTIKTDFNSKAGWLTASHLVEIKSFKLAVAPARKELFGIATKYLTDLFDIDHLSFVVPMTGSLSDPNIGVGSSVEQIMLKLLDAKFKDHAKAVKWARWGGDHFGSKLDKALRRWLESRRKA